MVTVERFRIEHGDALEVLRGMPDNAVDAIVTDPPYHRVKALEWDRQWKDAPAFLAWIGELCEQWQRVLRPNGSLYCFASPKMAARVEVEIGKRFNVLNQIVWNKDGGFKGWSGRQCKEEQRAFFPHTERIIFAEHYGADNMAKGEAGYATRCDELRGFVFEPLRAYLDGERIAAGFDRAACDKACGNQMSGHYFSRVQWALPTRANYEKLREAFNAKGNSQHLRREYDYLRREYDYLRREYEDLRREYEDLRRPFRVTADVPYTDVWDFPTVQAYKGKHPCEKPLALMLHIIRSSTREGATVLDCFAGSGAIGDACLRLGRNFIGIEKDSHWCQQAQTRLAAISIRRADCD